MRKNHTESQLSIYAAEWQKTNGPKKRGPKKKEESNCGNVSTNTKTRDAAGDKFGITGRTVSKAANVLDKGCKQLQQAVKDEKTGGNVSTSKTRDVAAKKFGIGGRTVKKPG